MPGDERRRYAPALGLVPNVAVLPHFETFGNRWVSSALEAAPNTGVVLLGPDERTAAVFRDGDWVALGVGGVTVIAADGSARHFDASSAVDGLPDPVVGPR
jgi:hypothetical protein